MRVIAPEAVLEQLDDPPWLIVDLRKAQDYANGHVPGAVHLDRAQLVRKAPPVGGLLPEPPALEALFGAIGLGPRQPVLAYDEEGGGWAGRLMWTLDAVAHRGSLLLDGGWVAWQADRNPVESGTKSARSCRYRVGSDPAVVADRDYIQARLGDDDLRLLDTRTAEEFAGTKCLAARGGRIPGARNFDWVEAMDKARGLRLKPRAELRERLAELDITPDKEVVVYCQTHHRSSHTYVVLRHLGFERVRGYPGAWSEWGNRPDTPVEV